MSTHTLQIIGSGDAFGSGGRLATCFMVQAPSQTFLIDCGISSLIGLQKLGIDPNSVDTILLTHYHGDHFGGVPYIVLYGNTIGKRTTPLTICGPAGTKEKVLGLLEMLYPGTSQKEFNYPLHFMDYQEGETKTIGNLKLEAYKVLHSEATNPHGLKVEIDGKKIGFSGDTEWSDNLIKIANNTDIFICECNNLETETSGHLTYRTIEANKEKFKTRQLILNHFGTEMLRNMDKVELEVAEDGKKIAF